MWEIGTGPWKTEQGRAGQGSFEQGRTVLSTAWQGSVEQSGAGQGRAGQGRAVLSRAGQGSAGGAEVVRKITCSIPELTREQHVK